MYKQPKESKDSIKEQKITSGMGDYTTDSMVGSADMIFSIFFALP
jgi:hypothetical protein